MDSRCSTLPRAAEVEALLRQPLVRWPDAAPVAVRETVESASGAGAAILAVAVDAASPGGGDLAERAIEMLTEAVAGTYPAWLPEAEHLAGPGGAGRAALRAICERVAGGSDLFGPFLVAAAQASLSGDSLRVTGVPRGRGDGADGVRFSPESSLLATGFPRETVVRQARKLLLRACGRDRLVVMVEMTGAWSTAQIEGAEANALWLTGPGQLTVWLFGDATRSMTRVPRAPQDGMPRSQPAPTPPAPYLTPLRGRPNAFSRAEQHLEAHLAKSPWAAGRAWNEPWSSGALANSIRVDIMWARERCIVELDGPDHLDTAKYAADRARDRALQRAGFLVLRYTNAEVLDDVARVLDDLERFLEERRRSTAREA